MRNRYAIARIVQLLARRLPQPPSPPEISMHRMIAIDGGWLCPICHRQLRAGHDSLRMIVVAPGDPTVTHIAGSTQPGVYHDDPPPWLLPVLEEIQQQQRG